MNSHRSDEPKEKSAFSPVRIGLVGAGAFGMLHAHTIRGIAEAELVAVIDSNEDSLSEVSRLFSGVPTWSDLEEGIAGSDVDAWIIATSTASHVAIAKALLSEGKTILLEKPLSSDLKEAKSLKGFVIEDSSNLMMGHVALFNSEFVQLRDEATRRGPIELIDCVRHRPASTLDNYPGESPFHLTMVHDLYLVAALKPDSAPAKLSAQAHVGKDGATDIALAQLQWSDGTLASFTASFKTPPGMASDGFDRMEVFGDGWAARASTNPRPLELWDEKARWPLSLEIGIGTGMLAEQLRCFCRVVRKEESVPVGARYSDALRVQEWLETLNHLAQR